MLNPENYEMRVQDGYGTEDFAENLIFGERFSALVALVVQAPE